MNCNNCGFYNNPGVNYCVNCGTQLIQTGGIPPVNNNYQPQYNMNQQIYNGVGTITFNRSNSIFGCALVFSVFIDGNEVGKIKRGESLTINVPYGTHNMQLKSGLSKIDSTIVVGNNSRNLVFKCYVGMGFIQGQIKLELINCNN